MSCVIDHVELVSVRVRNSGAATIYVPSFEVKAYLETGAPLYEKTFVELEPRCSKELFVRKTK